MRAIFTLALIIMSQILFACGEEEISTIEEGDAPLLPKAEAEEPEVELEEPEVVEKEIPEPDTPQPFGRIIDDLEQGMEEKDVELYLEAFWDDDYFYHSDLATNNPGDDVMFDDMEMERESAERLFVIFDDFDIKFKMKELTEITAIEVEIRNHYELLVSTGGRFPGGYEKVFAEGDNVFTFKKRAGKWRIKRWEQEEMSEGEIEKVWEELDIRPPERVFIYAWGIMKLR